MTKDTAKQAVALINYYKELYFKRYGKPVVVNLYRDKYAMIDVVESVGVDHTKELLEYYFRTGKVGHPLQFFFYNFDKFAAAKAAVEEDDERINRLLIETQKRVEASTQSQQLLAQSAPPEISPPS